VREKARKRERARERQSERERARQSERETESARERERDSERDYSHLQHPACNTAPLTTSVAHCVVGRPVFFGFKTLFQGTVKKLLRSYCGAWLQAALSAAVKALLRLCSGTIKVLSRLCRGSFEALLRLCCGSVAALLLR
jgi:hypothetical protein